MKRIQKQVWTAAVLVVIGAGAGIYTLVEKVKTPQTRLRELRESQRLFRFGRIDVQRGVLRSPTGTVAFEATSDDGYRLTAPIDWPGDPQAISSILDHMAGLALDRVLTEDATEGALHRAGLDRPRVSLAVDLADGRQLTLHIGEKNNLVDRYPVTDGRKRIIGLIEPTGYWNYARPVDDFRVQRVFAVDPDDVTEVRIEDVGESNGVLLSSAESGWTVRSVSSIDGASAPADKVERADRSYVGLYIVRITKHLDADEYITDDYREAEASDYGLDPAAKRISLTAGDRTYGAVVGFVRETGSDEFSAIFWLDGTRTLIRNTDPTLRDDLSKTAADFVDRTVSRFDPLEAQRVTIEAAGRVSISIERDREGWRLIEPESREAKAWKVDSLVRQLSLLRASRWYADDPTSAELEEWRLDPWSIRLTVSDADGESLADLLFGKYADDTRVFVKRMTERRVGVVPDKVLRLVPSRWQDLVR